MKLQRSFDERLFSAPFIALILCNTLSSAGFYMTMPTLPKYALVCGMSLSQAGILTGIFSVTAIIARPFSGMMADRVKKKNMLLWISLLMSLATYGYSITHSHLPLYLLRILHGAAFAGSSTVQLALAASLVPPQRRGEGMGYMGMAQVLAMSFAPSVGLWAAERWGYSILFVIAGTLGILAAVGFAMMPIREECARHNSVHRKQFENKELRAVFKWDELFAKELVIFALISSLFSMSNAVSTSYLSMLTDERSIAGVGLFFTVSSVAVLLCKPFSGKLMDRKGIWFVVLPCCVMGAVAMFMVAGAKVLWPLLVAAALKGVAQSSGQSALQTECANRSEAHRTGVAMSTCYLGNDLGQGLGNALGGALCGAVGYGGMFWVVGALVLSGLLMSWLQRCIDQKRQRPCV